MFPEKLFSIDFMQQCKCSDVHTLQKYNLNSEGTHIVS